MIEISVHVIKKCFTPQQKTGYYCLINRLRAIPLRLQVKTKADVLGNFCAKCILYKLLFQVNKIVGNKHCFFNVLF